MCTTLAKSRGHRVGIIKQTTRTCLAEMILPIRYCVLECADEQWVNRSSPIKSHNREGKGSPFQVQFPYLFISRRIQAQRYTFHTSNDKISMDIRRVGVELRGVFWMRDEIQESLTCHIDRSPEIDIRSN